MTAEREETWRIETSLRHQWSNGAPTRKLHRTKGMSQEQRTTNASVGSPRGVLWVWSSNEYNGPILVPTFRARPACVYCPRQNHQVQPDGSVLIIVQIVVKTNMSILHAVNLFKVHHRPACYCWLDGVPQSMGRDGLIELGEMFGTFEPAAHRAHVSLEDIDELRPFI